MHKQQHIINQMHILNLYGLLENEDYCNLFKTLFMVTWKNPFCTEIFLIKLNCCLFI